MGVGNPRDTYRAEDAVAAVISQMPVSSRELSHSTAVSRVPVIHLFYRLRSIHLHTSTTLGQPHSAAVGKRLAYPR
jgi:hypothetical protein